MEYVLSPDSSILDIIDKLALTYADASGYNYPYQVWMQPRFVSLLNKELASRFSTVVGNLANPVAPQIMRIETPAGPVVILAKNSKFPIFIGSEQELEDNSFNNSMEEFLCE